MEPASSKRRFLGGIGEGYRLGEELSESVRDASGLRKGRPRAGAEASSDRMLIGGAALARAAHNKTARALRSSAITCGTAFDSWFALLCGPVGSEQ
jgi:hypothetical protein